MGTHNTPPAIGEVIGGPLPNPGISYTVQSGAEDNQGTSPTPYTSTLTMQFGSGSSEPGGTRMGASFGPDTETSTP